MRKILILGKIPPPIGGVTVHVSRLINNLPVQNFHDFVFCDLGKMGLWDSGWRIVKHKIIHLHVSNPWIQCSFALFCWLSRKKLILTYHGDWGRYSRINNLMINISAWLAYVPIVQNESSLTKAKFWNRRAVQISTFLPTDPLPPLTNQLGQILKDIRRRYDLVICTNAWNLAFDKNGEETYGISDIIRHIEGTADIALIISDPSGNYARFIEKMFGIIPKNVIFIKQPHDFRNVLRISDAFVRNTSTDGVSLSIHEAFELNIPILASSAVARPVFCEVYDNIRNVDFKQAIEKAGKLLMKGVKENPGKKAIEELARLYALLIQAF